MRKALLREVSCSTDGGFAYHGIVWVFLYGKLPSGPLSTFKRSFSYDFLCVCRFRWGRDKIPLSVMVGATEEKRDDFRPKKFSEVTVFLVCHSGGFQSL